MYPSDYSSNQNTVVFCIVKTLHPHLTVEHLEREQLDPIQPQEHRSGVFYDASWCSSYSFSVIALHEKVLFCTTTHCLFFMEDGVIYLFPSVPSVWYNNWPEATWLHEQPAFVGAPLADKCLDGYDWLTFSPFQFSFPVFIASLLIYVSCWGW